MPASLIATVGNITDLRYEEYIEWCEREKNFSSTSPSSRRIRVENFIDITNKKFKELGDSSQVTYIDNDGTLERLSFILGGARFASRRAGQKIRPKCTSNFYRNSGHRRQAGILWRSTICIRKLACCRQDNFAVDRKFSDISMMPYMYYK